MYGHFEANLRESIEVLQRRGVDVVVCTVVTNLADCPPFASVGPDPADAAEARRTFLAGEPEASRVSVRRALAAQPDHAEMHYLAGRLDGDSEALARARDLDALRFRADSRINAIIRSVAAETDARLVDARAAFPAAPGRESLYEHVHLTFAGNHRLAAAVAGELGVSDPASPADVARVLGYTAWDAATMHSTITRTMGQAPFTAQLGHAAWYPRMALAAQARLDSLRTSGGLDAAISAYAAAIERRPRDPYLRAKAAAAPSRARRLGLGRGRIRDSRGRVPGQGGLV